MIRLQHPIQRMVFDFDNTLYQTEKLKAELYAMAEIHGYTREEAKELYNAARVAAERIVITLSSYLFVLRKKLQADGILFLSEDVSDIITNTRNGDGLIPYARELLTHTYDTGIDMYLLSLGVREWQEEKVLQAKISSYFPDGQIVYTDKIKGGKVDVLRRLFGQDFIGARTAIFNDKPDETRQILEAFPEIVAFLRYEILDDRFSPINFDVLEKDFPGRVVWSDDLKEILRIVQLITV